jgi:hypothetical protein
VVLNLIIMVNCDPRNGEELGAPFLQRAFEPDVP